MKHLTPHDRLLTLAAADWQWVHDQLHRAEAQEQARQVTVQLPDGRSATLDRVLRACQKLIPARSERVSIPDLPEQAWQEKEDKHG